MFVFSSFPEVQQAFHKLRASIASKCGKMYILYLKKLVKEKVESHQLKMPLE